jgi:hypothetical protein
MNSLTLVQSQLNFKGLSKILGVNQNSEEGRVVCRVFFVLLTEEDLVGHLAEGILSNFNEGHVAHSAILGKHVGFLYHRIH